MFSKLATRQPKNLRKSLTNSKFEEIPPPPSVKKVGFFPVMIAFITDVDILSRANVYT